MADGLIVKDASGQTVTLRSKDLGTSQLPLSGLLDQAGVDVLGAVTDAPAANTLLARIKSVYDRLNATLSISATSLPLPTGASTSALQSTANASLASLVTNTTGLATASNQTSANMTLSTIANNTAKSAANNVSGTFSSPGSSTSINNFRGDYNVTLSGAFSGVVQIERSFDAGTSWSPITALGTLIALNGPCSEIFSEPEASVRYRLTCTSLSSGTISYRISQ